MNTADKDALYVRCEKWEEEYQQDNESRRVRMGERQCRCIYQGRK